MKLNINTLVALVAFALISCGPNVQFTTDGANYFGDHIDGAGAKSISQLAVQPNNVDTLNVLLQGTIQEVCQAKGCWMTLESDGSTDPVFIRFKDYGFFVPKDAGGKKAVIQGKLYTNTTSVDELRHYAEDKGQSKEEIAAITQPKNELRMMADGVIIYND